VATDLLGGAAVALSSGSLVEAVLASCAIPGVFPPRRIGARCLIDGAVASNTPIKVALDLGATRLVVLPTGYACALLSASPYDFSRARALIERAATLTRRWLDDGGLAKRGIPGALRPHED